MEIKNKIITIEDILKIGEILNTRHETLKYESEQSKLENENKNYDQQFYKRYVSYGAIKFSIFYGDAKNEREDFEWFKETLTKDAKKVTGVWINYNSVFYKNTKTKFGNNQISEHFRLSLDNNRLGYGSIDIGFENNDEFQTISTQLNKIIDNCSPRYDKTLKNKKIYRLFPSFAISAFIALIAIVALFALTKLEILSQDFATFLESNPIVLIGGALAFTIIFGFLIPNPNMALYKTLIVDKKYHHYDTNWKIEHYQDDYERFKNQVELATGRFYGSDVIRKKIYKNFKISIYTLLICIVGIVAFGILIGI